MSGLTPAAAVEKLKRHYDTVTAIARTAIYEPHKYPQVTYPKLIVDIHSWHPVDRTEPFGYVEEAGTYTACLSKPALMEPYLVEQLERLARNYDCTITVGDSGPEKPLFHFTPQRFDIACERIEHYTGLPVETVQKYILFTNYGMHTNEFLRYGLAELHTDSRYTALVLADGRTITKAQAATMDISALTMESHYQMPRYDLISPGNRGITMINIGVGPSNAKTITDCLAVLRPDLWIMIGHCAGLDGRMRMGDLILGNAYQRSDHLLDTHIPTEFPIPAVPEVQRALESGVAEVYGADLSLMRTGTVISTDDRNWEWHTPKALWEWLRCSTAIACDMESATLAANGYRYRIPYGTLLSVSDLPLHAVPKLPAAAQAFYSSSKEAHVMCAVRAVENLAESPHRLRTRKLRRTVAEVPFR